MKLGYIWRYILKTRPAIGLLGLGLIFLATPALTAKVPLPEGKGKDLVERICFSCHEQEVVTKPRLTKAEWKRIVHEMSALGAVGTAQEFDIVIDYLAAHFGKTSTGK